MAAAAAVALVAVLAWPRDDGDEVITVDSSAVATTVLPDVTVAPTTEPVPTTAPTTEATTTTSTTTTVAPVGHPTTAVAVTEDGRLVVLDTSGTAAVEIRELDRGPDPRIVPEEGETTVLADPALTPDGRTVYYSLCCEPVVGVLFSAAVDGSSPPVNLGYGTFPTVSPSGDRLAIVQYDAIVVRDLASGTEQSYPDTAHEGTLIDLAWSTDGGSLYYVRYEGTTSQLVRLPLDTGEAEVVATSEAGLRFPLGGDDGTATVVEQCCADGSESHRAGRRDRGRRIDGARGASLVAPGSPCPRGLRAAARHRRYPLVGAVGPGHRDHHQRRHARRPVPGRGLVAQDVLGAACLGDQGSSTPAS